MIDYRCADCIYLHYYDHFIERAADSTADCVIITIRTASRTDNGSRLCRVELFTCSPASIVQFGLRLPACPPLDSYSGTPDLAACHRRYMHSGNLESDAFAECCGHCSPDIPYRNGLNDEPGASFAGGPRVAIC